MRDRNIFHRSWLCVVIGFVSVAVSAAERVDYNREIRPLLSDRCFSCHGPDSAHRAADLRLDEETAAKESVIVPGKPEQSELIARLFSEESDTRMPPPDSGKSLSAAERELIRRWVSEGAPYAPAWAYVKPVRHPVPSPPNSESLHWIDRFILERLEREELSPSPTADRVTLIRRLSFDLTGLPPHPEEVDAFVHETDPDAYERLVDRLLASPHFGERMAISWLDFVRYADTVGYHGDQEHHISPYRDYVINAFHHNLPFDQFTREQLAGDLLPDSTLSQKVATGYNRMLQTSHEGGVQPKEYLAIYGADHVRNLSTVWMGATMGCCQCHDHKYDPFTIRDFYAMQAFFADIDEARHLTEKKGLDHNPTRRLPEIEVLTPEESRQLELLKGTVTQLQSQVSSGENSSEKLQSLQAEILRVHQNARRCMITVAIEPRPIRVLPRGNWMDDSGELVSPAIPRFLGELNLQGRRATRLDLANWLTDPQQGSGGLTARVMANRFWALLMGVGLSKSLDDFGGQGEPPVHPELLDNLAVEFYENGWNVKHLLKTIVMSRTYQQSSLASDELRQRDPDNRFYARQSTFRLPAEMIRDQALAVSGLLVDKTLGVSIRPYQPAGYYQLLNFPKREYQPDQDQQQWRRGVYMHWQRQFLHPMLKAFDAPTREECTAERPRSNTPAAALVLLNDPTFIEAARAFAVRLLDSHSRTDEARLEAAFRQALSRPCDSFEREVFLQLLHDSRDHYENRREEAEKLLSIGNSAVGRDRDVTEVAAWMQVTRALFNLSETITRY